MSHKPKIASLKPRLEQISLVRANTPVVKRIRGYTLQKIIQRIAVRDEYVCQSCHRFTINGEVDHITPLHKGGQETDENRQWICDDCHDIKTKKEKQESGF